MLMLWALVLGLTVIVLSLVRQLGVITVRLNPSAGLDLDEGPGPGSDIVGHDVPLIRGGTFVFGGERNRSLLIVFLSPDCSICTSVASYIRAISSTYANGALDLFVVLNATPRVAREYIANHGFEDLPVALYQNLPNKFGIQSTPFALAVTREGTVAARGTPNALEHLEEMVHVADHMLPLKDAEPEVHVWGDSAAASTASANGRPGGPPHTPSEPESRAMEGSLG